MDEIGIWSEQKLEIIEKYCSAYATVLRAQSTAHFTFFYIDGFAGAGMHFSKTNQCEVEGSPLRALKIPGFLEYHLADTDGNKMACLKELTAGIDHVFFHHGDCNVLLPRDVFPLIRYDLYRRAFCLLDPYGLHLSWDVIMQAAGQKTIDLLINFPIMDMNQNVLKRDPGTVDPRQKERMTKFWGDESWHQAAYDTTMNLFQMEIKTNNEDMVKAYMKRLHDIAGYRYVAKPLAMKNSTNATVYYLVFASHNKTAVHIMNNIFNQYR